MIRFSMSCSLDGYVEDAAGRFDFGFPTEEIHGFVNERLQSIDTFVFGRRMYETMRVWETMDDPEPVMQDFAALWHRTDKVVFSRTLDESEITTTRTRLEREFDPEAIRSLGGELEIAGPTLAAPAFEAGLFDSIDLYVYPVVIGGGKRALPDGVRLDLRLVDEQRFENGTVYLSYAR